MATKAEELKRIQDLQEISKEIDFVLTNVKLQSAKRKISFVRPETTDGYLVVENPTSIPGDTYLLTYKLGVPATFGIDDIVGLRDNMNEPFSSAGIVPDPMPAAIRFKADLERHMLTYLNTDFLRKYYILVSIDSELRHKPEDNAFNTFLFEVKVYISFMG